MSYRFASFSFFRGEPSAIMSPDLGKNLQGSKKIDENDDACYDYNDRFLRDGTVQ